jgi:inosine-uridine nucleoside N-ribohydrolase
MTTFRKLLSLNPNQDESKLGLQLHDPLTVWYALSAGNPAWQFKTGDVRVETSGQWTRGCCIVDRRGRPVVEREGDIAVDVVGDAGGWGDSRRANKVMWCTQSPGVDLFAGELLERVFGKLEG